MRAFCNPSTLALLWAAISSVAAHGDEGMDMSSMGHNETASAALDPNRNYNLFDKPSYAGLERHSTMMKAHIGLMVLAWFLVLPFGSVVLITLL